MIGYTTCQNHQKDLQQQMLNDEERAIKKRNPHQADGNNLYVQGNGLVLPEVADVRSEVLVAEQPIVETGRTAEVEGRREQ